MQLSSTFLLPTGHLSLDAFEEIMFKTKLFGAPVSLRLLISAHKAVWQEIPDNSYKQVLQELGTHYSQS